MEFVNGNNKYFNYFRSKSFIYFFCANLQQVRSRESPQTTHYYVVCSIQCNDSYELHFLQFLNRQIIKYECAVHQITESNTSRTYSSFGMHINNVVKPICCTFHTTHTHTHLQTYTHTHILISNYRKLFATTGEQNTSAPPHLAFADVLGLVVEQHSLQT